MCDVAVLLANRVDAVFGEQLGALSPVRKPGVLIVPQSEVADRAKSLAKDWLRRWVTMWWTCTLQKPLSSPSSDLRVPSDPRHGRRLGRGLANRESRARIAPKAL